MIQKGWEKKEPWCAWHGAPWRRRLFRSCLQNLNRARGWVTAKEEQTEKVSGWRKYGSKEGLEISTCSLICFCFCFVVPQVQRETLLGMELTREKHGYSVHPCMLKSSLTRFGDWLFIFKSTWLAYTKTTTTCKKSTLLIYYWSSSKETAWCAVANSHKS